MSPTSTQETSPSQISLHALSGQGAPETLRVTGVIGNHRVHILIDEGSTHNFFTAGVGYKIELAATNNFNPSSYSREWRRATM